jgi:hypothetical protein
MAPPNIIFEPSGVRLATFEDNQVTWYPTHAAADIGEAVRQHLLTAEDQDHVSETPSDDASSLSSVPTFSEEWSTKARHDGRVRQDLKEYDYSSIDWSVLSGFTIPLGPYRNLNSPIWRLGVPIECSKTGKRWWLCTECHAAGAEVKHMYSSEGGTHSAVLHIRNIHGKTWDKRIKEITNIPDIARSTSLPLNLNAEVPREQALLNDLAQSYDHHHFRRLLIRWIVYDNVSFRQVDSEPFREFIQYIAPRAGGDMPSANTVRSWIMSAYGLHQAVVKNLLTTALSKIHLAFDLWTSGNHKAINGIVAHFIDNNWKPHSVVLGVPELKEAHSGDKIAAQVVSTVKDYGIDTSNIGYFMLDNATNNDTAVAAIAEEFGFEAEKRRLRCAGHIINLIARSLLYGFDKTLFEDYEDELIQRADLEMPETMEEELARWRRCGPVGKAHNLIVWLYTSPQRVVRWHEG